MCIYIYIYIYIFHFFRLIHKFILPFYYCLKVLSYLLFKFWYKYIEKKSFFKKPYDWILNHITQSTQV